MEQVFDNHGSCFWLVTIPGDGDCLFGAIVHQIYGMTPRNPLFKHYSQQAREAAVSEIRMNLPFYFDHVASYADELMTSGNSIQEKVEQYLDKLRTAGFWGGAECISALSNHFQVVLVVHQDSSKIEFAPANSEHRPLPRLHLYYRGHGAIKNHYDSVLCIRLDGTAQDNDDLETVQLPELSSEAQVREYNPEFNLLN